MEIPAIEGVGDAAPGNGRWIMWENVMPDGMEHVDLLRHPKRALKKRGRKAGYPGDIAKTAETALLNALWADRLG